MNDHAKAALLITGAFLLGLALLALVGPARGQYRPTNCQQVSGAGHTAPGYAPATDYFQKLVLANAVFPVFDTQHVKDVFVFTGPPPALPAGVTVGINAQGQQVQAGLPAASPPSPVPAPTPPAAAARKTSDAVRAIVADDEAAALLAAVLDGFEPPPPPPQAGPVGGGASAGGRAQLLAEAAVSLRSCAACHTAGVKTSGSVAIFSAPGRLDPNANWNDILAAATSAGGKPAAMPPQGRGSPLSAQELLPVKALAGR